MILDSSAIVAIVYREPEFETLVRKLRKADVIGIGAPTATETGIVLQARLGIDGRNLLERFLQEFDIQIVPFEDAHWREAMDAYRRFGKGRHPAALNFGDCLSYATASILSQPLLFVGNAFSQTDIASA